MKPVHKAAIVAGGYTVSFLLACAAVALRIVVMRGPASQAASGMYGFGDMALLVGVFGVTSLVPTAAVMFFVRDSRPFWTVLSASSVMLAVTGVTAAILYAFGRGQSNSGLAMLAGYSVLRILISPLLVIAFILCGVLSPFRAARIAFLVAAGLESSVSVCGGSFWILPQFLHRM